MARGSRWRRQGVRRALYLASLVSAALPVIAQAQTLPRWARIEPGAVGYLADEGNGRDTPRRRTVCRDFAAYIAEADAPACRLRRAFGLVRVQRIVGHSKLSGQRIPIVAIASTSGGWSGVVTGLALIPILPRGTRLQLDRGADFSYGRFIGRVPPKHADGFEIAERTLVEVLHENAPDLDRYSLRVRILTGPRRNAIGWTSQTSIPYGAYWMQEPGNIIP